MNEDGIPETAMALIDCILNHVPQPTRDFLRTQVQSAKVAGEVPGRTLDLVTSEGLPRVSLPDGPLRPIPAVLSSDGQLAGELMLWVKRGVIVGLEQPWFGQEPPDSWPAVDRLDFSKP